MQYLNYAAPRSGVGMNELLDPNQLSDKNDRGHDDENTADSMVSPPLDQQLTSLDGTDVPTLNQQLLVDGGLDDDKRERNDRQNEKGPDELGEASP